ncbi:hypothetical protein BGX26_011405 [Mortierella sp. AD094]|nr:hypothetical protein BGX26_011405 [Mortierella sp. AD094]
MDYSGLAYSNGTYPNGSNPYSTHRRTLAPATAALPYLPSLQRCVATLETSTLLQFELVSEQDITNAQVEVARDVEPQLFTLTEKVVQEIYDLESKEYQLIAQVQAEEEKEKLRIQRQKAARSGISNIKKLQSLTRRKEELSRSASELEDVLDQKRQEFSDLIDKIKSTESQSGIQSGPFKRLRRNPTNESRELNLKEEERKREIARRDQELESIQQKIQEKRKSVNELRSKVESQNRNPSGQHGFNPSVPWTMYSEHYKFLERTLQTQLKVDGRDKEAYEEAFARFATSYLRELDSRQAKTDKELSTLTRDKTRKLSQMRNLCKQLFPGDSIGQTMVKVIEMLNEFPPEEERRHNLGRVVSILKQVEVIELVLETREAKGDGDEDGQPGQAEEQLILRIKFDDGH